MELIEQYAKLWNKETVNKTIILGWVLLQKSFTPINK